MTNDTNSEHAGKSTLLNKYLNISAVLVAAALTLLLVKSLMLVPERYYFGFAKVVDYTSSTPFLVTPPLVDPDEYQKILEVNNYTEWGAPIDDTQEAAGAELSADEKVNVINESIMERGKYSFWISLLLKMLPPFLVGYFLFFVWKRDARSTLPIGAAIAAFLLCWPVVMLWESVVYDVWYRQKNLFLVLYLAYILLYYNLARLGVILGKLSFDAGFVKTGKIQIDWGETFSSLITTGVTVTITWFVTTAISRA